MKKCIFTLALILAISFSGISGSVSASSPESNLPSNEAGYTVSTEAETPQAPNPDEPDLPNPDEPDLPNPDDPMTPPETGSLENGGERPQGPFPPEEDIN